MDIHSGGKKNNGMVSVIMSVYNAEKYLRESIDSLLAQTYKNLEIIIINDGSTDLSREIISSYKDKRIVFINRIENLGLTKSLNEGLSLSKGTYIARQDADDISLASRIEEQVDFLEKNPEISILGTGIEWFSHQRTLKRFIYSKNHDDIKSQLLSFFDPIPHPTLIFRKQVLEKLNGYNNFFALSQDYDFLLRASETFKIGSLQIPLVKLRYATNSLTHRNFEQLKYGLAALICAHRRLRGYTDYSKAGEKEWQLFLANVDSFIKEKKLDRRFIAKNHLKSARCSLLHYNILQCIRDLSRALESDRWCLCRKGFGLNIPDDIEQFLT